MGFVQPWSEQQVDQLKTFYVKKEGEYYLSHGYIAQIMGVPRAAIIGKIHRLKLERDPTIPYLTQQGRVIDPKVTTFNKKTDTPRRTKTAVNTNMINHHRNYGRGSLKKATPAYTASGIGEYTGTMSEFACQVVDLTRERCHFPIGHVSKEGFHFCGDKVSRGSYCKPHADACLVAP